MGAIRGTLRGINRTLGCIKENLSGKGTQGGIRRILGDIKGAPRGI